jgi:hypothetical protein
MNWGYRRERKRQQVGALHGMTAAACVHEHALQSTSRLYARRMFIRMILRSWASY